MPNKNIGLCLFFSIITCGIYGLYWLYCLAQAIEKENLDEPLYFSPGMLIVLTLATFGLFSIFAFYKWACLTPELLEKHKIKYKENRIYIYILFCIFGLSILNLCIIQDDFNKIYATPHHFSKKENINPHVNPGKNPPPASYR